jgi:hypothetical protein
MHICLTCESFIFVSEFYAYVAGKKWEKMKYVELCCHVVMNVLAQVPHPTGNMYARYAGRNV